MRQLHNKQDRNMGAEALTLNYFTATSMLSKLKTKQQIAKEENVIMKEL